MQEGARTETLNVQAGSFSFKTLFETAAQKFQEVKYEANPGIAKGVNSVDNQIQVQTKQFNTNAAALYDQYIQQRNSEATPELSGDKTKLEYKDAKGITFKTENVTVETNGNGLTMYKDSHGKLIYSEDSSDGTTTTSVRDASGNILTSTTRNADGQVTNTATNTYNENGQRTSRTYTADGQTLTSTFTYNDNGTLASEVVTDAEGNVVETTKYDKNGNEVSYNTTISNDSSTTKINQTFNKKGNLTSSEYTATLNDGTSGYSTRETFRGNGNLKTRTTDFVTSDPNAQNSYYHTESTYRRGGEMKYQTVQTRGNDGSQTTSKTKFRGDGETKQWIQTGTRNSDATTTAFRENFNIDNEATGGNVTIRNSNGKVVDKSKIIVFDNKENKVPSGYTAVKGFENHYSNNKGEVFVFVKGDNGKPLAIRDHSTTARMHEARLKRDLETQLNA